VVIGTGRSSGHPFWTSALSPPLLYVLCMIYITLKWGVVDDTSGDGRPRATQRVGGGVWIYGIGGGNSYSYYDHGGKTHKSTACAGFGTSCRSSGWVAKGTRSVAQVLRTAGGNTAFWDTK
jgi:lactococcin 972 family bacteriocin